jgi:hypothetical protein
MPWGAVVGAAVGLYGASKQSSAAKSAANTQAQASTDANRLQLQMFNQSRQDNEPFRQNAMTAQNEYMQLMGLGGQPATNQPSVSGASNLFAAGGNGPQTLGSVTGPYQQQTLGSDPAVFEGFGRRNPKLNSGLDGPWNQAQQPQQQPAGPTMPGQTPEQAQQSAFDRFRNTPGYQFGLDTGRNQLQSSAAAHGGLYSGATMKALQRYGNDYADQQGYTPYMNRLASLANMGQTANTQNQQAGQNYANQAGYNLTNAGNARASAIQQSADAWGQAASGIGSLVGKYWGGGWGGV